MSKVCSFVFEFILLLAGSEEQTNGNDLMLPHQCDISTEEPSDTGKIYLP